MTKHIYAASIIPDYIEHNLFLNLFVNGNRKMKRHNQIVFLLLFGDKMLQFNSAQLLNGQFYLVNEFHFIASLPKKFVKLENAMRSN